MKMDMITRALAMTLLAVAITRSLISVSSLFNVLWHLNAFRNVQEVKHMTMGIKKLGIITAATLIVLTIAIPAFMVSGMAATPNAYDQQILQARYDMTSANIGFVTGVMNDTVSLVPQASNLQAPADKLNSDLTTLKGYVSSDDRDGFSSYVKNTIVPDVKSAQTAIKDDRTQWKSWNVSLSTIQQLKTDYQNSKTTYDSQVNAAWVELGNARLQYYNSVMSNNDAVIANMTSKGLDVSGMQAAENSAKSNVIAPLQSAVSSGDATTIKNEIKAKALGDGTPYSAHFFASDDLARLQSISSKISASGNLSNSEQQQLNDANAKLNAASSTLQAVGTSPYSGSQSDQIWGDSGLKGAAQELKTIIGEIKGSQNQG